MSTVVSEKLVRTMVSAIVGVIRKTKKSKAIKQWTKVYGHDAYLDQYGTIKVQLPRRAGNTEIAIRVFKTISSSVLVSYDKNTRNEICDRIKGSARNRVYAWPKNTSIRFKQQHSDIIVLDNASSLSNDQLVEVRSKRPEFIVKLG